MRRKRWQLVLGATLVLVVAFIVVAALRGNDDEPVSTGDAASAETEESPQGERLVQATANPPITADPGSMKDITGRLIDNAVYQTLLGFTGEDVAKPEPILAESYEMSPDNKRMTLKLRSGMRFSDGSPVTLDDVLFSLKRVKYLLGQPAYLLTDVDISSSGEDTVVLESDKAVPELPFYLTEPSLGIVNSKVVKANGGLDTEDAAKKDKAQKFLDKESAGSGPFVLKTFSTTGDTILTANPEYAGPGPKPGYREIVIRIVPSESQRIEVQRGTTDIALDLSSRQAEPLAKSLNVEHHPAGATWFLLLNNGTKISKVSSNPDFQAAVRYAIDYDKLLKLGGAGTERMTSITPQNFSYSLPPESAQKYDPEEAKRLLASSGIDNPSVTFEYPDPLSFNGIGLGTIAASIQTDLEAVGIKAKLKPTPVSVAVTNYRAGTEEFALWVYSLSPPDPISGIVRQFQPGGIYALRANWKDGASPEVTEAADQVFTSASEEERTAAFERFYTAMNSESPFVPLFSSAQTIVFSKNVSGVVFNVQWTLDLAALRPAS